VTEPPRRAGRLGKRPPDPSKPRLRLTPHLTTAAAMAAPPATVDYLSRVGRWPMYGNDQIGDCVFAGIGHAIEAITTYGAGTTIKVSEDAVITGYSDVTGFTWGDPDTDQGTVMQDALNYWRKTGVGGHTIVAFALVNHASTAELKAALNLFGVLLVGFMFPPSAADQFDRHRPWEVAAGPPAVDGHAVHVGYESLIAPTWRVTTWGAVQKMTQRFWATYVDEVWVPISQEWVDATGHTPTGLDLRGLGEQFSRLTGQPNPWPHATPGTSPSPTERVRRTAVRSARRVRLTAQEVRPAQWWSDLLARYRPEREGL
jgi:hypothetical protein